MSRTAAPSQNLLQGFADSLARDPERPALRLKGRELSYADLGREAARIAQTIRSDE